MICSKGKHLNLYLYINIVYLNNYIYLIELQDIKLPFKIKMCGRPKGASMTTIGLKKKKKGCLISFRMQHDTKKQEMMLKWVIADTDVVMRALLNIYHKICVCVIDCVIQ